MFNFVPKSWTESFSREQPGSRQPQSDDVPTTSWSGVPLVHNAGSQKVTSSGPRTYSRENCVCGVPTIEDLCNGDENTEVVHVKQEHHSACALEPAEAGDEELPQTPLRKRRGGPEALGSSTISDHRIMALTPIRVISTTSEDSSLAATAVAVAADDFPASEAAARIRAVALQRRANRPAALDPASPMHFQRADSSASAASLLEELGRSPATPKRLISSSSSRGRMSPSSVTDFGLSAEELLYLSSSPSRRMPKQDAAHSLACLQEQPGLDEDSTGLSTTTSTTRDASLWSPKQVGASGGGSTRSNSDCNQGAPMEKTEQNSCSDMSCQSEAAIVEGSRKAVGCAEHLELSLEEPECENEPFEETPARVADLQGPCIAVTSRGIANVVTPQAPSAADAEEDDDGVISAHDLALLRAVCRVAVGAMSDQKEMPGTRRRALSAPPIGGSEAEAATGWTPPLRKSQSAGGTPRCPLVGKLASFNRESCAELPPEALPTQCCIRRLTCSRGKAGQDGDFGLSSQQLQALRATFAGQGARPDGSPLLLRRRLSWGSGLCISDADFGLSDVQLQALHRQVDSKPKPCHDTHGAESKTSSVALGSDGAHDIASPSGQRQEGLVMQSATPEQEKQAAPVVERAADGVSTTLPSVADVREPVNLGGVPAREDPSFETLGRELIAVVQRLSVKAEEDGSENVCDLDDCSGTTALSQGRPQESLQSFLSEDSDDDDVPAETDIVSPGACATDWHF